MYVPNHCCLHNILEWYSHVNICMYLITVCLHNIFEWYSHVNICMYLISVVYITYLNDIAM